MIAVPAHWGPATVRALFDAHCARDRKLAPNGVAAAPGLRCRQRADRAADQSGPERPAVSSRCSTSAAAAPASRLADAERIFQPIGETVRYPDFSGDQIDQAVLDGGARAISPAPATSIRRHGRGRFAGQASRRVPSRQGAAFRGDGRPRCGRTARVQLRDPAHPNRTRGPDPGPRSTASSPPSTICWSATDEGGPTSRRVATVGGGGQHSARHATSLRAHQGPVVTTARPDLDTAVGAALFAARVPTPTRRPASRRRWATPRPAGFGLAVRRTAASRSGAGVVAGRRRTSEPVPYTEEESVRHRAETRTRRPRVRVHPADRADRPAARPWYRVPQVAVGVAALIALIAVGGVAYTLTIDSSSTTDADRDDRAGGHRARGCRSQPPPPATTAPPPPPPAPTTEAPPPPPPPRTRRTRRRPAEDGHRDITPTTTRRPRRRRHHDNHDDDNDPTDHNDHDNADHDDHHRPRRVHDDDVPHRPVRCRCRSRFRSRRTRISSSANRSPPYQPQPQVP